MSGKDLLRQSRISNCLLLFLSLALLLQGEAFAQKVNCRQPGLSGSFLQPSLVDGWSASQWSREYEYMKAACLNQLVLQWTADDTSRTAATTIYPTALKVTKLSFGTLTFNSGGAQSYDAIGAALTHADQKGVQVYLGL